MLYFVYNETAYYLYNGHVDVVALVDGSGNTLATYYYDVFGNIVEQTGTVDNNITYAGYQYDKETGKYYLNARMYDPITARFMQEDTYRGNVNDPLSLNLYTYCHNEPLMYTDPNGHWEWWDKKKAQASQWWDEKKAELKQGWEDYKSDWKTGADMIVNHPKEAIQLVKSEVNNDFAYVKGQAPAIAKKALQLYVKARIATQPENDFVTSLGNHLGVRSIIPDPFYNQNSKASNFGKALGDTISIGMVIKGLQNAIMPKSPSVVTDTGALFDESTLSNESRINANMINKASSNAGADGANNAFQWTGKSFKQIGEDMSPDELINNLEQSGWKKTIEQGGKKSGTATILTDQNTGTTVRIHAQPSEGTPYFRVQNNGGGYLDDSGTFPSNATKQELRDLTHFYFKK